MFDVSEAVRTILDRRSQLHSDRALLCGVTGIDGSGKGFVAARIAAQLRSGGVHVAAINLDGWLNLPSKRFSGDDPGQHFYDHAIRFEALFAQLILPLQSQRSVRLEADLADATDAEVYRRHTYEFQDVDIILLEGILLLKKVHRAYFDLSIWIDCTFETALERALQRSQEGLPPEETIRAYETIYFPAQRIHLTKDEPRAFATVRLTNDPRLGGAR